MTFPIRNRLQIFQKLHTNIRNQHFVDSRLLFFFYLFKDLRTYSPTIEISYNLPLFLPIFHHLIHFYIEHPLVFNQFGSFLLGIRVIKKVTIFFLFCYKVYTSNMCQNMSTCTLNIRYMSTSKEMIILNQYITVKESWHRTCESNRM